MLRPIVDFMLPPRCPGCGAVTMLPHRFCAQCWVKIDFLTGAGCALCTIPLRGQDGQICGTCLSAPPAHDGVIAATAYGDIARKVILTLKYARRPGIAHVISGLIAPRIVVSPGSVIIPVPLHRWRLWSRGFNQSLAIARALATRTNLRCEGEILVRKRATPSMRGMNPGQRNAAVKNAFTVRGRLDDARILLVDDVFTTGATANACAKALKQAGASSVTVLCWARVVGDD